MRSPLKQIFLLAFLFLPSFQLFAQTDSTRIRTTPEIRAEIYEQFERSNKQIKELDAAILNYLGSVKKTKAADYKKTYAASQQGWLNYRNGHCQFIADQTSEAPTGPDQFFYQCIADINASRVSQLDELLTNFKLEFGALKMK